MLTAFSRGAMVLLERSLTMTKPFQQWKVLPHGKLSEVDDNILTVTGELQMPLTNLPRRMTVARLNDSRLVVFSAIALDEVEMQALEDYGRPAFLVVPNDHHRLDAKVWKERYPSMQVVAPGRLAIEGRRGRARRHHEPGLRRSERSVRDRSRNA
jgi:hypothetical protein